MQIRYVKVILIKLKFNQFIFKLAKLKKNPGLLNLHFRIKI